MVELANGRWMVVFETWKAYDDPSSMTTRLFALFSSDQGRTWDIEHRVQRWDATGQSRIGSPGGGSFLEDVSSFAFGKPDVCVINDTQGAMGPRSIFPPIRAADHLKKIKLL